MHAATHQTGSTEFQLVWLWGLSVTKLDRVKQVLSACLSWTRTGPREDDAHLPHVGMSDCRRPPSSLLRPRLWIYLRTT